MGDIYHDLGEQRKALEYYQEALRLMRAAKSPDRIDWHHNEAKTLVAAGRVHLSLGEKEKAFGLFRQALERHLRALPRLRNAGGAWETKSLSDMARIYELLGEPDPALDHYGQALARYRASNGRMYEYVTLTDMAAFYSSLGRHEEALAHHRQSLQIRLAVKDLNGAAEAHYQIARIQRERGQVEEARREIESALSIVESLRARIAGESLRASYFGTVQKYYEFYTDLLMSLHAGRPEEGFAALALEAHERSRARTMLETLVGLRVDLREGVDPELVRRERGLRLQLNASAEKQMRLLSGSHTAGQAAAAAGEIEALTAEYETVEARIRAGSPRYAELVRPAPLTLKEIQTDILDGDTLLLEYALGSERSYLWLVAKDSLTAVELPARDLVERAARRVHELLSDAEGWAHGGATAGEYAKAAASLSRMLLPAGAVAAKLGKKRLVVIADGLLNRLPFSALPAPSGAGMEPKPLVLDHEVISLPSATTLSLLRRGLRERPRAPRGVAVLADPVFDAADERVGRRRVAYARAGAARGSARRDDPGSERRRESQPTFPNPNDGDRRNEWLSGGVNITRLPFTRREAEAILAVAASGDELRALDFGASRETVAGDRLKDYRIVHFATHGLLNGEQPRSSGIVLSLVDERGRAVDGFLSLGEIYKLNLSAELVVLSACQTGLGKEVRGEGLIGLVRGFMYAGAPRVVASLWKVDDRATAELMRRFYEGMLKEGLTPAAALRRAKVEMLADERWRAPFYWAAFELQGEWK
ncbi:MAG: CHAT domain-containing protein [Acidobacteria bacterium]|nr:CHAT domain-containing protein [Acidobacteriota bacterium]